MEITDPTSVRETKLPIASVLRILSAGEGCDGYPYDQMMIAADYIEALQEKVERLSRELRQYPFTIEYSEHFQEKTAPYIKAKEQAEAEVTRLKRSDALYEAKSLGETFRAEQAEAREKVLREALETLVEMYVANPDSKRAFISCITPPSAHLLTPLKRKTNPCWSAWDKARVALNNTKEILND